MVCYWTGPALYDILRISPRLPVLIMWGSSDKLLPPSFGTLLARLRPGTDFLLIDNGSHNPVHSSLDVVVDTLLTRAIRPAAYGGNGSGGSLDGDGNGGDASFVREVDFAVAASGGGGSGGSGTGTADGIRRGDSRGRCVGCNTAVAMRRNYWYCGCGHWTYHAVYDRRITADVVEAMKAKLEELHVHGTFDARTSKHVHGFRSGAVAE